MGIRHLGKVTHVSAALGYGHSYGACAASLCVAGTDVPGTRSALTGDATGGNDGILTGVGGPPLTAEPARVALLDGPLRELAERSRFEAVVALAVVPDGHQRVGISAEIDQGAGAIVERLTTDGHELLAEVGGEAVQVVAAALTMRPQGQGDHQRALWCRAAAQAGQHRRAWDAIAAA